jgi:hypothetical protein
MTGLNKKSTLNLLTGSKVDFCFLGVTSSGNLPFFNQEIVNFGKYELRE